MSYIKNSYPEAITDMIKRSPPSNMSAIFSFIFSEKLELEFRSMLIV